MLLSNADNYLGLISKDLKVLKDVLDAFHQQKIPVVLMMLSLTGSRWKQNNNDKDDLRLWSDQAF